MTLFQAGVNRGQERGPRENADEEYYGDLQVEDLAAILELNDNLNRDNRAVRIRSPTENALPTSHEAPADLHLVEMGNGHRGSMDNLQFHVDNRQIDWNEEHNI